MFVNAENSIRFCKEGEWLTIRPWGKNGLRVQACRSEDLPQQDWALTEKADATATVVHNDDGSVSLTNGKITAKVNRFGKITFFNHRGETILQEYWRDDKEYVILLSC